MAKDPAVNWYFDNWSGGVKGFSRHQKGCYMDLLESQFYLGHLSLDQVKNILGPDFTQWPTLKAKFIQDAQGNFFNERLELEKNKRARYSESRSNNRKKKDMLNTSNTYEKHISNTPEIGTETVIEVRKGGTGENLETVFREAFDEITLANTRMTFPEHDVGTELKQFYLKVTSAPKDYEDHGVPGLRKAFIYQLKNAKRKKANDFSHVTTEQRNEYLRKKWGGG